MAEDSEKLVVNEIFLSIQGESSLAGWPCAMVRLTGCPLECSYCDTRYAREQGTALTLAEVLGRVDALGVPLVEVTGGEPLAQRATPALLRALCDRGHTVLLETSGALDIAAVDPRVRVIMDVKCPGSGMSGRVRWENLARLRPGDEVKFVLSSREDYAFMCRVMAEHGLAAGDRCTALVSVADGALELATVAGWMLRDRLRARLQVQLHKVIWPGVDRGV